MDLIFFLVLKGVTGTASYLITCTCSWWALVEGTRFYLLWTHSFYIIAPLGIPKTGRMHQIRVHLQWLGKATWFGVFCCCLIHVDMLQVIPLWMTRCTTTWPGDPTEARKGKELDASMRFVGFNWSVHFSWYHLPSRMSLNAILP